MYFGYPQKDCRQRRGQILKDSYTCGRRRALLYNMRAISHVKLFKSIKVKMKNLVTLAVDCHMWLVAITMNMIDIKHFQHHIKFCWAAVCLETDQSRRTRKIQSPKRQRKQCLRKWPMVSSASIKACEGQKQTNNRLVTFK